MTDGEKLIAALKKAAEVKIQDKTLNFEDEFLVAPQVGAGKSIWAKWLRDGMIKPYDVLWAFRDVEPKQWLAIRIAVPFDDFEFDQEPSKGSPTSEAEKNVFFFNLQNSQDRWRLKQLEEQLGRYMAARQ